MKFYYIMVILSRFLIEKVSLANAKSSYIGSCCLFAAPIFFI